MNKLKLLFSITICTQSICNAQSITPEVIGTAGEFHNLGNQMVQFTIGEPVVETFENDNQSITQGFHQLYIKNISIVEEIDREELKESLTIYPNPFSAFLTIEKHEKDKITDVIFYDLGGSVLLHRPIFSKGDLQEIDTSDLPIGLYCIVFFNKTQILTVSKVLKIK